MEGHPFDAACLIPHGITRYEVWRLPPAEEGGVGLVSFAVVADMTGLVDTFQQIDDGIERWQESLI
jgi:hypothetical protein